MEQVKQTLDIKNFQSYSSVNDTDKVLMTKNGADASITIALLREILSRNVKPTIIDGVWHIGAIDTGIQAIGKSPQFQTSANGIEWRYEGDIAWIPLVSYEQLKLKFSDLTPEQFQTLKLTLADLTVEEIAELQRPATETIESVKKVGTDATAAEKLRVEAEGKRATGETSRTTKESERLQAETSRVNAEENRASAETLRTGNETTRVSKETERITAEGKRVTAETARDTKESERITAESGRVTAETARATAESERVLLFKTLKTDSENTTALASEVASHPTYVGVDNYVYAWNKTTKAYDKTTIYVKGEGLNYTTMTHEEKESIKGLNAYQVAVENGFIGTIEQWLASLQGTDGAIGANGITPHIGENGNWYIGTTDTGIKAQGVAGTFDPTTEFPDLTTNNKTITRAINEINATILPSVINNPQIGDTLVYNGEKWANQELPDEGAYIPYGYEFITENNIKLLKCVKLFPYPRTYTNNEGVQVTDVEYKSNQSIITYLPPIKTDLDNLSSIYQNLTNLEEVSLVAPRCTNANSMFSNTPNLKKISLVAPLIEGASGMFKGCNVLVKSDYDFLNVKYADEMFIGSKISKSPKFGIGKLISCYSMFEDCVNLSDLNGIDLSSVTEASFMFRGCTKLNISIVKCVATAINYIFTGCVSLENMLIDIPNSYTARSAFSGCVALKTVTMNGTITGTSNAFSGCVALTTINADLTNGDDDIDSTFENCSLLTTINLGLNIARTRFTNAFKGCSSLTTIKAYLKDDLNLRLPFADCTALTDVELKIESSPLNSNVFKNCGLLKTAKITFVGDGNMDDIFTGKNKLTSVEVIGNVKSLDGAFSNCTELTSVKIVTNSISMRDTFLNCHSLTNLQLSRLNGDIRLYESVLLTKESLLYLFNNAIKQPIYKKGTIILGEINLAKLTSEEKKIATDKYYILK